MAIICFYLSCNASRRSKTPWTLTRERRVFYQVVLPLSPNWHSQINPPSHTSTSHLGPPCCCSGLGTTSEERRGDDTAVKKYKRNIVRDTVSFQHDLNRKQTRDMLTKSSGLGSSPGVPLGSSVSAKALVFQYTATETADTVGKCLCRARPKPLRLR